MYERLDIGLDDLTGESSPPVLSDMSDVSDVTPFNYWKGANKFLYHKRHNTGM